MRLRILVNVPLSRAEVTVPRQGLNVAQRSADVEIFRAALVIKVRLPLWLEQPSNPRCRYQRWKRFTIACGEVAKARSVLITYGPACGTVLRYSIRAFRSSSLIGIILPDLPLLAVSWRQIARPISPWESLVIHQVSRDLLGPQASLGRQDEDQSVPFWPAGLGQVTQDGFHLALA
jgi:hypothetical protein